jgi:hypothetical protein
VGRRAWGVLACHAAIMTRGCHTVVECGLRAWPNQGREAQVWR